MDKKVGELTLTSECSRVSTAPTPAAVLSMPCRNLFQVILSECFLERAYLNLRGI